MSNVTVTFTFASIAEAAAFLARTSGNAAATVSTSSAAPTASPAGSASSTSTGNTSTAAPSPAPAPVDPFADLSAAPAAPTYTAQQVTEKLMAFAKADAATNRPKIAAALGEMGLKSVPELKTQEHFVTILSKLGIS